jgi:hypothetical protein
MVSGGSSQQETEVFDIPEPAVARHPSALLAPRELRAWLDQLPLANPPKAAGMLLRQLRLLSRDPHPGPRFLSLLDLYRVPLETLLEIVEERMQMNSDNVVALDQLETLVLEGLSELAYAELRIANQLLATGRELTVEVLLRPMRLLDQALAIEISHYHKASARNWSLMRQIFLFAESHPLAAPREKGSTAAAVASMSITGLYLRALLISFCDPYHHRPGDMLKWRAWAAGRTEQLQLSLLPQGAASIPIDISGAMMPLAAARCGKPGPDMRYLDIGAILKQLVDDREAPAGLHQALDTLIKGRRKPEQRQTDRQPRDHAYQLTFGLRRIHGRLNDVLLGHGEEAPEHAVAGRQTNQSRSGAAFRLAAPLNAPLVIGEPVLAETGPSQPGAAPAGFTACVRRVLIDGQQVEIGVEKLSGRILPVTLSGSAAERARFEKEGLLQQRTDSSELLLIAARGVYREGDRITVEGPGVRYELRMLKLTGEARNTAFIAVEPSDY